MQAGAVAIAIESRARHPVLVGTNHHFAAHLDRTDANGRERNKKHNPFKRLLQQLQLQGLPDAELFWEPPQSTSGCFRMQRESPASRSPECPLLQGRQSRLVCFDSAFSLRLAFQSPLQSPAGLTPEIPHPHRQQQLRREVASIHAHLGCRTTLSQLKGERRCSFCLHRQPRAWAMQQADRLKVALRSG